MIKYTSSSARMWSRLGPSGAFGAAALELGETDPLALMVTADLRFFAGLDRFATAYPDRLLNLGIAEQNMVGVAAGFASEGFHVFASTYATFGALRSADQVKVNMGYMRLPVKLVGLAAGFSAGILGPTHMALEDAAAMRAIPNITVLSPADGMEIVKSTLAAAKLDKPVYLRLTGAMGCPAVYHDDYEFEIGKAIRLTEGSDALLIATGSMVYRALEAAKLLADRGISCTVCDMHTIKPLDTSFIDAMLSGHKHVFTLEEHSVFGGLGEAVAAHLVISAAVPLTIIGVEDFYPHAGEYENLMEQAGLAVLQLAEKIERTMRVG